jgi:hypothetical protein
MNRKRVEEAAEYLENLESDKGDTFDMFLWYKKNGCCTAACALGWLANRFKELSIKNNDLYHLMIGVAIADVQFESYINYEAAEHFFGLDRETVHFIFDGERYENCYTSAGVEPGQVAERLRDLVKDNG